MSLPLNYKIFSSRELVLCIFESFSAWHKKALIEQVVIELNYVIRNGFSAVFLDYFQSDYFLNPFMK